MNSENKGWTYKSKRDNWMSFDLFNTRAEADRAAVKYGKQNGYSKMEIGEIEYIPLPSYIDPDDILEMLNEDYEDSAGVDYDRDLYEGVKDEDLEWLEAELSKVVNAFHERANIVSTWYEVTRTFEISVG